MRIMIYYPDYMGYQVKVTDKNGVVTEGVLISYDHGYDEQPEVDYDSIGIQRTGAKGYYIGIPIPDIIKFEVLD